MIFLAASFLQISLNFLSFFVISQPYILAIVLFITIRRVDYEVSSILLILYGLVYDLITGGLIGIHSLFFLFLKLFTLNFRATQDLDRRQKNIRLDIHREKEKLEAAETEITTLKDKVTSLETTVADLVARLTALETA